MTILHAKHTAATLPVATQDDVAVLSDETLNDVHGGLDLGAVGAAVASAASTWGDPGDIEIASFSWGMSQRR